MSVADRAAWERELQARLAQVRALVEFLLARAADEENPREAEFTREFVTGIVPKVEAMADEIEGEWPVPHVEVVDGGMLLRLRAAVYRDHPDYDPAWAPDAK